MALVGGPWRWPLVPSQGQLLLTRVEKQCGRPDRGLFVVRIDVSRAYEPATVQERPRHHGSVWVHLVLGVSIVLRFLIWKFQLYTHKREDGVISPLLLLPSFNNYQLTACLVSFVDPVQPCPGSPGIPSDCFSRHHEKALEAELCL